MADSKEVSKDSVTSIPVATVNCEQTDKQPCIVSVENATDNSEEYKEAQSDPLPEESKQSIRLKVWNTLEKKNYVLFPRPCKGRIPHFVGSPEACVQLATLDCFKKAQNVKVNPDKPQEHARFLTLEAGKTLLVPIPRLRSGLFRRILPPPGASKEELKAAVAHHGIYSSGQAVSFDDKVTIDLVVMGAVAVSKEGHRIGKGEGYADLEFAIMMKMGAITQETIVVTTVHDEQVFDTLPHHLFKDHDVPVDFIVTPTQIYEVTPRLPKPTGIFWNLISNRRLQIIPILKTLRAKEIEENKDCTLKEVDSELDERPMRSMRYFRRIPRRPRRDGQIQGRNRRPPRESSAPPNMPNNNTNSRPPQRNRQSRTFHRKQGATRSSSAREQPTAEAEVANNNKRKQQNMVERVRAGGDGVRPMRRYFRKPKHLILFSIRVSGISQGTRVRDLKTALSERGVRPYDISWESNKGRATLHFTQTEVMKDKPPQLQTELTSLNIVEGLNAKLEMKLPGNAKDYKYEWRANGNPLNKSGRFKVITRLDGIAALVIGNVTKDDAGEYTVTIKNKHGEISSKGCLSVEAKTKPDVPEVKPSFTEAVDEITADKNSRLEIALSIAGNPVPDIEWTKEDAAFIQQGRMQLICDGTKASLIIYPCIMSDSGVYKCKLKNDLGEAETEVKVTVNSPPPLKKETNLTKDITVVMDDLITTLQDLKLKQGDENTNGVLSVEPGNPISRIESTGISAV